VEGALDQGIKAMEPPGIGQRDQGDLVRDGDARRTGGATRRINREAISVQSRPPEARRRQGRCRGLADAAAAGWALTWGLAGARGPAASTAGFSPRPPLPSRARL
jgi:hypothetical protein